MAEGFWSLAIYFLISQGSCGDAHDVCDFELPRSIRTQVIMLMSYCRHTDTLTQPPTHPRTDETRSKCPPATSLGMGQKCIVECAMSLWTTRLQAFDVMIASNYLFQLEVGLLWIMKLIYIKFCKYNHKRVWQPSWIYYLMLFCVKILNVSIIC